MGDYEQRGKSTAVVNNSVVTAIVIQKLFHHYDMAKFKLEGADDEEEEEE